MHLFRVLSEVPYCSVFSNSWNGNSFRYWWRHVTFFSSQATHRHPQLVPVSGKMLCPFQPYDHSHDHVSGTIASFSCYLDLFGSLLAFLGASVAFSGFMVSSSNSRLMVCRENARAS